MKIEFFYLLGYVFKVLKSYIKQKHFIVMFSTFLLIMLYGYHGNLDLLINIFPNWSEPGLNICCREPIISFIPWDREFISFTGGFLLLVILPLLMVKFVLKEPIVKYGISLPPPGKRKEGFFTFLILLLVLSPGFYFISKEASMQSVYPFFKNFKSATEFILYEITYLPFFVVIEFIFRGYLLFGLEDLSDENLTQQNYSKNYFIGYGLVVQMLAYTAWHLGKPLPELWGTPVWGLSMGVVTYYFRSIWPVTMLHWALNVFMDAMILHNLHKLF